MGNGSITTARGLSLNIDEIIQQAQRPIGMVDEASTRETGNYQTPVLNQPKVRGFVPTAGEAVLGEIDTVAETDEKPAAKKKATPKKKASGKTLAEMTQVTVKETEAIKAARSAKEVEADQTETDEDETLGDIISDMDAK